MQTFSGKFCFLTFFKCYYYYYYYYYEDVRATPFFYFDIFGLRRWQGYALFDFDIFDLRRC